MILIIKKGGISMLERREVWLCVILGIVTCGLYNIYWQYMLADDLYKLNNEPSRAGVDLLLTIVTCGIYGIYMSYKYGEMEESVRRSRSLPPKDDRILYVILHIFGLWIITAAIVQSHINDEFLGHVVDVREYDNNQN